MKKEQMQTRLVGLGLLTVFLFATGAFLRVLGEETTGIAVLLGIVGMGTFLYWGILLYGYGKTYRMPV